ncbi:MAG TPA: hypothetical protein VLT33_03185 [Labilithrix sp.]|nr:hypothetical protein [Labilithrix sp.]
MGVIDRERRSLAVHRATLKGSVLPPLDRAAAPTFSHGFLLPFSLISATLRDPQLRGPYLRVALVRGVVLVVAATFAIANGSISSHAAKPARRGVVIHSSKHAEGGADARAADATRPAPVHVHVPGLDVDIEPDQDQAKVSLLGQDVPVSTDRDDGEDAEEPEAARHPPSAPEPPPGFAKRLWTGARERWAWILALVAFLSAIEAIIVFFSRRWDDWMSFQVSRLAQIRPEDEAPKSPRLAVDPKWAYRKLKRRIRGYVVFGAGLPALLPLRLLPTVGDWAFTIAVTLWGWYWLGIFSASKSAHAWADEATAPSPFPIRELSRRVERGALVAPLRLYARLWARLTRSVNPAAATFERSVAAFLGLALARALLSLPGVYFLARPIVPVAAGRLCAETDPADRFSAPPVDSLALAGHPLDAVPRR